MLVHPSIASLIFMCMSRVMAVVIFQLVFEVKIILFYYQFKLVFIIFDAQINLINNFF